MELTPLDIRNQNFHVKKFGGFDPEEVKAFLNQVSGEMEKQSRQRTDLTERLKIAEERVNYYKLIEKTLQDSVLTMQKTVDEIKRNADKEAELIIAEAKARALREVEATKKQAEDMRAEIELLKQQRTNYFIRIRALLRGQDELLTAMERDQDDQIRQESNVDLNFRTRRQAPAPTAQSPSQVQQAPVQRATVQQPALRPDMPNPFAGNK